MLFKRIIRSFNQYEEKFISQIYNNLKTQNDNFDIELTDTQKKEIQNSVDIFCQLSLKEREYMTLLYNHKYELLKNESNHPINKSFNEIKIEENNYFDKLNMI